MKKNKFFHENRALILEEIAKELNLVRENYIKMNSKKENIKDILEKIKFYHNQIINETLDNFNPNSFIQKAIKDRIKKYSNDKDELIKIYRFKSFYSSFISKFNQYINVSRPFYFNFLIDEMKTFLDNVEKCKEEVNKLNNEFCFIPFYKNVEISEDGIIRPYYTIYQTNYNPSYFGDMQSINSDFLAKLFALIYNKDISNNIFILNSYNKKLENYPLKLLEFKTEAFKQNIYFNLMMKHPSLSIVQKSIAYKELKETRDSIFKRLVTLENSNHKYHLFYFDIRNIFDEFLKIIVNYKIKIENNASIFRNHTIRLSSLNLKLNILNFIETVFKKHNLKEDELHNLIDDFNNIIEYEFNFQNDFLKISKNDEQKITNSKIIDIYTGFKENSSKLKKCLSNVEMLKKEIDDIYQITLQNRGNEENNENKKLLLKKEREEIIKKMDIFSKNISYKMNYLTDCYNIIEKHMNLLYINSELQPLSKTFKNMFPQDKTFLMWKEVIFQYLKECEENYIKINKKVNFKIKELKNKLDQSNNREYINRFESLVSCPICGKEASHCLTTCGHLFCSKCAFSSVIKHHKCYVCSTIVGENDIIKINW